jgi:hypothetical protein
VAGRARCDQRKWRGVFIGAGTKEGSRQGTGTGQWCMAMGHAVARPEQGHEEDDEWGLR